MSRPATAVQDKRSLRLWLGMPGVGLAALASLIVLGALAIIFLLHHPVLRVPNATVYLLIGAALIALLISIVLTIWALRAAVPTTATATEANTAKPTLLQFRIATIAVLLLSLITSVLVLVAPFQGPCPPAFSDSFHGKIDSCWTWVHPTGGSLSAQADGVRMVGAPLGDLYTGNTNAPRLLQPLDSPNFTIETTLTFRPVIYNGYQGAGILIWQDSKNFLRVERGNFGDKSSDGVGFGIMTKGTYIRIIDTGGVVDPAQDVSLRVERQGDIFTAWWRENDQGPWFILGSSKFQVAHAQVGLTVAVGPSVTTSPAAAIFHRFTLVLPRS